MSAHDSHGTGAFFRGAHAGFNRPDTIQDADDWQETLERMYSGVEAFAVVQEPDGRPWLAWESEDGDVWCASYPREGDPQEGAAHVMADSLTYPLTVLRPASRRATDDVLEVLNTVQRITMLREEVERYRSVVWLLLKRLGGSAVISDRDIVALDRPTDQRLVMERDVDLNSVRLTAVGRLDT